MTEKTKERLIEELKAEIEVLKRRQSHLAEAKNSETQRRESTLKTEKENLERILKDHKRELENQDANLRQAKRAVNAQNAVIEGHEKEIKHLEARVMATHKERQDLQKQKDSNSMKSFETPEVIQELLNTISKQRKKAKKYKRMYQDARQANLKLSESLIELEGERNQINTLIQKLKN